MRQAIGAVDIRMKAKLLQGSMRIGLGSAGAGAERLPATPQAGSEGSAAANGRLAVRFSTDGSDQPQHQDGDRAGADRLGGLNVVTVEGGRLPWERAKQQRDQTA
jgi:hypothetical protein